MGLASIGLVFLALWGAAAPTNGIVPYRGWCGGCTPIIGVPGVGIPFCQNCVIGAITIFYPNGAPTPLESLGVNLLICATTEYENNGSWYLIRGACTAVPIVLNETIPGYYTYVFTPPSAPTGAVIIYIPAGTLTDGINRFPRVDTPIGSYTYYP